MNSVRHPTEQGSIWQKPVLGCGMGLSSLCSSLCSSFPLLAPSLMSSLSFLFSFVASAIELVEERYFLTPRGNMHGRWIVGRNRSAGNMLFALRIHTLKLSDHAEPPETSGKPSSSVGTWDSAEGHCSTASAPLTVHGAVLVQIENIFLPSSATMVVGFVFTFLSFKLHWQFCSCL